MKILIGIVLSIIGLFIWNPVTEGVSPIVGGVVLGAGIAMIYIGITN